jgi:two-component system OmpR family sensor kinase
MARWRPGGLPIFWQTLLLLLASLVVSQFAAVVLLLSFDPPRPDFNRLTDVAAALSGRSDHRGERMRERRLDTDFRPAAPRPEPDMIDEPRFTAQLARRLDVSPGEVRLYFEPDQRRNFPFARSRDRRLVPLRRGEPIFFNDVVAALRTDTGWKVVRTPPPPLIAPWQRRLILWFGVSALALLPFAWFFARRLSKPIQRFALAADRLGADPLAPPVPEEGPAELRLTAHALNRMQHRLAEYVRERTAMIGAIAHDLRTPLARIAFRIEGAPDPIREKVQGDIDQMRAMIAATIGFVRNSAKGTERSPLDLLPLLAALVDQERDMGHDVTLARKGTLMISGDPLALGRLFQNLIDNAIGYGSCAMIEAAAQDGQILVTIADRGPGLAEDLLDRMFQPFERGEPSRNRATGGIGLGLTIARSIAEDHGGTLTLANRAGGGLEARCTFPRSG